MADINVKGGQGGARSTEQPGTRSGSPAPSGTGREAQAGRPGGLATRGGRGGLAKDQGWGWRPGFGLSPLDIWNAGPFEFMRRMSDEMDRMFQGGGTMAGAGWIPPVEVAEREGKVVVSAELPGLRKDDVRVEATDEGLVISGERRHEREEEEGGVYRSERSYGSFRRVIPLPEDAQLDQAQARFESGVLEVSVPVPESSARRRRIPITGETTSPDKPSGGRG